MNINAKIISDSISNDIRLCTLSMKAPKFLDAEFEKHRMISSNSSSDRAIPILKALDNGYFLPEDIRLNQSGMQGDLLLDEDSKEAFWNDLKELYGYTSNILLRWDKVHKQHLNRYLMGFAWQNKISTATEWDNFFYLRLDKGSDPAMQKLAKCMKEAMYGNIPNKLEHGEWHLPYWKDTYITHAMNIGDKIKCSVARCARVSYNNHDNSTPNINKDILLAIKLLEAGHMSCFEHQATSMKINNGWESPYYTWPDGITHQDKDGVFWSGNFRGFIQYRQLIQQGN